MRVGENPTKFTRKNPSIARLSVKVPRDLTVTTVTYVPHLEGYYKDGLDIIKLTLASVRKNTNVPFDLMVFDNGSCREVTDYLVELKNRDVIQWLFLSSQNVKKLGAWNIMFPAARGDMVYYFNSDIFHYPGWLDGCMKIMQAFPRAGFVGACPFISLRHVESTLKVAEKDKDIRIEKGSFIGEDVFRVIAESLGADQEHFVTKKTALQQVRLTRNGVSGIISASHNHFLTRAEVLRQIFPRPRDWAINFTDKELDRLVDELGYMRLSTQDVNIYHLGNALRPEWREKAPEYDLDDIRPDNSDIKQLPAWLRMFLKIKPVNWAVMRLYAFFFKLVYGYRY